MRTLLASAAAGSLAAASLAAVVLAGPASASPVPACGNASLTVTHTGSQGATGHSNFVLLSKNRTHASCSLTGYPGFDALRANGSVLAHAKRTKTGFTGGAKHIRTIVVKPGHYASADVEWLNFNPTTGGNCAWSKSVATTPANTADTVHLKVSVSRCGLEVHPTVSGKSGNGS